MIKNKPNIKALKQAWKYPKDFDSLTTSEQLRFIWWHITGNPRGLIFLMLQVKFTYTTREAYDKAAKNDKLAITMTLAHSGYYSYLSCC